ncbi:tetratricopeptide repeat protein [Candidatus Acetothermia bacterium]|jgi:predicted ATPase/DNA-binding SARP family transcriptional activator|nr:tetratricopeptide repeat protein [Candidatus Acetothermia bacterium]MCI2432009.1 tetratricopeptide repeat protein [Candidatus Acetothermia bacterium]MCI2436806.1 tetratricopeptide repeat protein [Candidatus Acetothermia bacterium]
MRLEIFLFGKFEVRRNGELLIWRNAKTQALLKILAGERGRVFSVDELIEYLWPEEEKNIQSTASNLRARVAELRRTLEPGLAHREASHYIETQRGGYALRAEADCWIDTEEFTRFEEQGRRTQREKQLEEAIALYEKAVALYRGEYLADDRYEDWALHFRERWRERYVELLSELADALAQRGRYREALHTVRRAIEKSPLQEQLYRQWMVYAHCAGEPAEARRAYLRCREVLERELGEHPSSRTEEIYRQLQRGEFTEIQDRYPIVVEPSVTPAPKLHRLPFCGRRREWQQLSSALQKAQEGHGVLVLVSGEPGMGKTRLCEEFCAEARERVQALFLTGRCLELKNPLPLHPWLEALQPAVSQISLEKLEHLHRSWLAECAELLPALCNVIPQLPQEVSLPAEHRPYRLFETLFQMLCALARQRAPLLIALDDLQWADEDSIDLLCYVMDKWTDLPLMILATVRSGARTNDSLWVTLKDHAQRRQWLEEIDLKRLTATDTQELVARLDTKLERVTDATNTAERLHRESAGNPLFLSTILQSLFENGCFIPDGAQWRLQLPAETELPPQVLQLIEHRVARAGPAAQRLLQLIACAVQIELDVLECAWEGTSEELFAHLDDLIAQGILTEHQGRYEFSHDKYREAIYRALEGPRKLWLHRRLAQALESVYTEPTVVGLAARLAEHYERGGQPQRALEWVFKTIALCDKHYQNREGLELASRGLAIIEQTKGRLSEREWREKELELMLQRIGFAIELGQVKVAQNDINQLLQLTIEERDRAKILLRQAHIHRRLGRYLESLQSAQDAYLLSQQLQEREMLKDSLSEIGLTYFFMGEYQQALEHLEQALNLARSAKHLGHEAYLLTNCANVLTKLGHFQSALSHYKIALQIHQNMKDLIKASVVLNNIGAVLRYLGDYQQALNYLEQACHVDREMGDRFGLGFSLCNLAQIYRLLGQYDQAQSLSKEALRCFVELEDLAGQAMMLRWQGILHREQQDFLQAQVCLDRSLEIARALNAKSEEGESLLELGQTLTNQQKLEESLKHLQQALAIAQTLQIPYMTARCWMALSKLLTIQKLLPDALTAATEAMQFLTQHKWSGEFALQAHFQHYRVLKALGHPEAQDALRQAQEEVQKTAALITDPALRQRFLQIPLHQEILSYTSPR